MNGECLLLAQSGDETTSLNVRFRGSVKERRLGLFNNDYRIHFSDGRTERRRLQTIEELASVLQNDFEINLPDG